MLRPIMAGDGLLVRIKPTGGILSAATAHALADLAARHGNGRLDLTARAALQMRGIDAVALPALVAGLRDLGLVDADAAAEAVRNVVASPLAGLHAGPDIRPLVAVLEARLAATPALHALPGKFGFIVDDGSALSLATVSADVRFDWTGDAFAIGLGGDRATAVAHGACAAGGLVDRAEAIARGAIALFARVSGARRMHDLLVALGIDAVIAACGPPLLPSREKVPAQPADEGASPEGSRPRARDPSGSASSSALRAPSPARGDGSSRPALSAGILALAPPYGRLDADMLRLAAALAGDGELRLTPWRSLLVPGAGAAARERARHAGFIVEADDPRRAVAACVGAPECRRATTATRAAADALIDLVAALPGADTRLHVSGCTKGCALAGPAPVTLVARDGRYDLVVDGRAGDPPVRCGLDLAEARSLLGSDMTRHAHAASTPARGRSWPREAGSDEGPAGEASIIVAR